MCSKNLEDNFEIAGPVFPNLIFDSKFFQSKKIQCFKKMSSSLLKHEIKLRTRLANKNLKRRIVTCNNGDIRHIKNYVACFTKALPHDKRGKVSVKDFLTLLRGLRTGSWEIEKVKLGGSLKLVDPACLFSTELFGLYPATYRLASCPNFSSVQTASEMAELYAMALLRDLPFTSYTTNLAVMSVCDMLNGFSDFRGPKSRTQVSKTFGGKVTSSVLFRCNTRGDVEGPYVSQFFFYSYNQGIASLAQKYVFFTPGVDYMTTNETVLSCQNGTVLEKRITAPTYSRYITNLRDGASYCYNDLPGQPAATAAMILLTLKTPFGSYNPYANGTLTKEAAFVDFGIVDMFNLIERGTRLALLACWQHKWSNLRLRPEAFGIQVQRACTKKENPYGISRELLESPILKRIAHKYGSYYLPQAYPEGCPVHPAYPGGHAVLAGCTITIVKAFFDCSGKMKGFVPSSDGTKLVDVGIDLNINDELDKYASNIAMFRSAAGIHYRSDNQAGLELGELVGLELLHEHVKRYTFAKKVGFVVKKRNGDVVKILNH